MDKLRVAVIGVGYLGRFHAQKYASLEQCELVGVVDTRAEAAQAIAHEVGTAAYGTFADLPGRIDAVSIATPTAAHAAVAAEALAAGAHVLVEKPICDTPAQARELIALARRAGRVLAVGHLERFNPAVLAAERWLAAPRFIECQRLAPFKERGTDVNVVLDLMIHDLDLVQTFVRSPVTSLDAIGTPVFSGEIDIANARLRFANGCVANVTASRVSLKTERKLRVFRDDAYLSIDLSQKILTLIRKRSAEAPAGPAGLALPVQIEEQSFEQGDALLAEIRAFLAAARGEQPVVVSGEDGLQALETAIAITRAVEQPAGQNATLTSDLQRKQ